LLFLPLVARWEVYRMPQPREAATTLCASKILRFLASVSVEIGVAHFEYLEKKFRMHG